MDKKYTTITISKELSYKIRKFGLENNMKTSEVLEKAVLRLYEPDFASLSEMVDRDLGITKAKKEPTRNATKKKTLPSNKTTGIEKRVNHVTRQIKK